jgi:hypothetical protein
MVERYQFSATSHLIRETLRNVFEEANPGEFQGVLRWLWTVKSGQWTEDEAVMDARSKGNKPETTRQIFRYLRGFDKHDSGYTEWCIRVIPEAARAHFEMLRFGQRVDRRAEWGRLTNTEANAVLSAARSSPKFPFRSGPHAQHIWDGEWGAKFPHPGQLWFDQRAVVARMFWRREIIDGVVSEKRASAKGIWEFSKRPTRRSVSAKHNARRFGLWTLHSQTPKEREKQVAIWQRSHPEFRAAVKQHWGEEFATITGLLEGLSTTE